MNEFHMQRTRAIHFFAGMVLGLVGLPAPVMAQQCDWSALGSGVGSGPVQGVLALAVFDDGTGPALYAGGMFITAGGVTANHIAKWDGTQWSPLGGGMDDVVVALTVYDDGTGPALYAGGRFTRAGGVAANNIAKWDGTQWSALGSGLGSGFVGALTVYDDGTGPALYAGGCFPTAGGVAANNIAKWDGTQWSALGSGMGGRFHDVYALTVYDDGTGPALYAGGDFTTAGGMAANAIAKWDGTQWSRLGFGVDILVKGLVVFDDNTGPALYACGNFTRAGGVAANNIAKWDGTQWSALGSGLGNRPGDRAEVLAVYDDGTGPALYAGGEFSTAGGRPAKNIAKWHCVMP